MLNNLDNDIGMSEILCFCQIILFLFQEYPYIFTNKNSDVDWSPDTSLKLGRKKPAEPQHNQPSDNTNVVRLALF